jgi:hypothetical protein
MVFLVSLIYIIITYFELPYLLKKKLWLDTIAFCVLMVIAWIYSLGWVCDWHLPTVITLAEPIFTPITQQIEKMLS